MTNTIKVLYCKPQTLLVIWTPVFLMFYVFLQFIGTLVLCFMYQHIMKNVCSFQNVCIIYIIAEDIVSLPQTFPDTEPRWQQFYSHFIGHYTGHFADKYLYRRSA